MTALDGREVGVSVVWAWFEDEYTRHALKRLESGFSASQRLIYGRLALRLRYSCGDDILSGC